jgi:hypothetical protein
MSDLRAQRDPLRLPYVSAEYCPSVFEASEQVEMHVCCLRVVCKAENDSALEQRTAANDFQRLMICACDDHRLPDCTLAASTV